jgi:hypothetical protein
VDTFVYFVKGVDQETYKLSFISFGGAANGKATFFSDNVLSVNGVSYLKNSLKIYPNPGSERIHVEVNDPILALKIINSNGKEMNSFIDDGQISVRHLANGLYNVMVQTQKGWYSASFIKN